MKKTLLLGMFIWIFIGCEYWGYSPDEDSDSSESSSIYYLSPLGDDENNGSKEAPWKSIQNAIDKVESRSILILKAGVYSEKIVFSGEKNSNLSLKGEVGAILDGSRLKAEGREGLVSLRDVHHVSVENLEIRNFKTEFKNEAVDTPVGILIEGESHDINITKNRVHHIENLSSCGASSGCASGANGISIYGNKSTAITNVNLLDNEVYNCILSASETVTINGNVDGFKVLNNYIHDNNNIGLDIVGYEEDVCPNCSSEENRARNGIIKGNRIINNSTNLALGTFNNNPWYEGDGGSAGGFYVDGGHHILFEGNFASQNDIGFEFASEHAGTSSSDILMVNNYIYNNREVGLSLGGYSADSRKEGGGDAQNIMVYNNSFYKNAGWGSEISLAFRVYDTTFANNILFGEGEVAENVTQENMGEYRNIKWLKNLWWAEDVTNSSAILGESIIKNPLYMDAEKGNLDINSSSSAVDEGVVQDNITSWQGDFWESAFLDAIIPAHGSSDIHGGKRINSMLDLGADEV
jgi:hypothetical protein